MRITDVIDETVIQIAYLVDEPLDGDQTRAIARYFLKRLDQAMGNAGKEAERSLEKLLRELNRRIP